MNPGDLKTIMQFLNVEAVELSQAIGVTPAAIYQWMQGKRTVPLWARVSIAHLVRTKAAIDSEVAKQILAVPLKQFKANK